MTEDQNITPEESNPPLVSVIMNCYNGEKFLKEALGSVLGQTYTHWELIFWDNQSADRSADVFKSYNDPRFKYFYAPKHTLLYEARNYAIEQSCGEFIAFLDVDDWWCPGKLAQQIFLFSDTDVGLVYSNYWVVDEIRKKRSLFRKKQLPSGWVVNDILEDYPVGMLTLVVRRIAFDRLNGGCNPAYHVIGDLDLVVRLAVDWKMACNQNPLAFYRLHGENEGQRQKKRQLNEYKTWIEEQRSNPKIVSLPAFEKVLNEVHYMEGLILLGDNNRDGLKQILHNLPWGIYKYKLFIRWRLSWVLRLVGI
jgi:glycosyltransferase involved in cell wall biosynthesis